MKATKITDAEDEIIREAKKVAEEWRSPEHGLEPGDHPGEFVMDVLIGLGVISDDNQSGSFYWTVEHLIKK